MKMIMAIVQPKDSNRLRDAFNDAKIGATKLSSTGGFLREGNTTFLIGVADDRVDDVLEIVKKIAESREHFMSPRSHRDSGAGAMRMHGLVGGATVFVLPVEQFLHF